MKERLIENWLINASERMYQIPFTQILIQKGFTVLHISSHGVGEHGKDIIALDKNNQPICFQLKKGDINMPEWRKISSEIDDMIGASIIHSSINPEQMHASVIVSSGMLSEDVRMLIEAKNIKNKSVGLGKLNVITRKELIKDFSMLHSDFFPEEPNDIKDLLFFYTFDGRNNVPEDKWAKFLERVVLINNNDKKMSVSKVRQLILSASVLCFYALNNLEHEKNHISLIKAWTIFLSYVFLFLEKMKCKIDDFDDILKIYEEKILSAFSLLKDEVLSIDDYMVGSSFGEGAGQLYSTRITLVLGFLAAYELIQKKVNSSYIEDRKIVDRILNSYKKEEFAFLGEAMSPLIFMIAIYLFNSGEKELSIKIAKDFFNHIIVENSKEQKIGYPDPYYSIDLLLKEHYGVKEIETPYESFIGTTYTARPFLEFLVKNNEKEFLSQIWENVLGIGYSEFVPDNPEDLFFWKSELGKVEEYFYEEPTKWQTLIESSSSIKLDKIPRVFKERQNFIYHFILTYPHRLSSNTWKLFGY